MAVVVSAIISIICIIIAISISKGYLNSNIEVYKSTVDKKDDERFSNRVRDYLTKSFYVLSFIIMALGIISYSGYQDSVAIMVMALITWFAIVLIGVQFLDKE